MPEARIDRRTLCKTLAFKFSRQYLGDRKLVLASCTEWFTGADSRFSAEWCESLVDFVMRSVGERDYCDSLQLATNLRKAPPIRRLFGKRKRIFIVSQEGVKALKEARRIRESFWDMVFEQGLQGGAV